MKPSAGVQMTLTGDVAIVTIGSSSFHCLTIAVCAALAAAIEAVLQDDRAQGAVIVGEGEEFATGLEPSEDSARAAERAQLANALARLCSRIEEAPKPIVAAIRGRASGAGLELAMACHHRIATPAATFSLPEMKIGLIPSAGGTQRLPRLVGVAKAIDVCVTGQVLRADEALASGLLDRLADASLMADAVACAQTRRWEPPSRTCERNFPASGQPEAAAAIASARAQAAQKQRGLRSPQWALDAIEASTQLGFDAGCKLEQQLFAWCLNSEESPALVHAFLGQREAATVPGVAPDAASLPVQKVGVVGAGTMGGGIAMVFASAGISVVLKEADPAALSRGWAAIERNYATSVKRGRFTPQFVEACLGRITRTLSYDNFSDVDLVIEAAFESMAVKKQVFGELDEVCPARTILASNTSSLDIDAIASISGRPEMILGMHFFSPAPVMRLVEVVRGQATSKTAISTCMQLAQKLGKISVLVGNCPGFVGNRMFFPYHREAQFLVEEGAAVHEVDQALYEFGMAMGPLATADLTGLDISQRIRTTLMPLEAPQARKAFAEDLLCELGQFGQKTGSGWYRYDANRKPNPNPKLDPLILSKAAAALIPQRKISSEEIVERCIYALVNEGAKLLEASCVARAVDIDIVFINGFGFPAARGGPMWYASGVGLKKVYERVLAFQREHGAAWEPAPLLARLAAEGKTFADFDRPRRN